MAEIIAVSVGASICCPISCFCGVKYFFSKYDIKFQSCCKGNGDCFLYVGTIEMGDANGVAQSCNNNNNSNSNTNHNSNSNNTNLKTGGNVTEITVNTGTGIVSSSNHNHNHPDEQKMELPPITNAVIPEEDIIFDLPVVYWSDDLRKYAKNQNTIGFFKTNKNGRLTVVSRAFEKISGKESGFLIDPSLTTWDMITSFIYKDDRERLMVEWANSITSKQQMLIKFRIQNATTKKIIYTVTNSYPYYETDIMKSRDLLGFRGAIIVLPSKKDYDRINTKKIKDMYMEKTVLARDSTPSSIYYDLPDDPKENFSSMDDLTTIVEKNPPPQQPPKPQLDEQHQI